MDMIDTITSIGGYARLRFYGHIPRIIEDGTVDKRALDDQIQWMTGRATEDIMTGRVVEYHDDEYDDDYTGNPYMVISTEAYWPVRDPIGGWITRRLMGRKWRLDFVGYPNVKGPRSEWLTLAYRITEVQ